MAAILHLHSSIVLLPLRLLLLSLRLYFCEIRYITEFSVIQMKNRKDEQEPRTIAFPPCDLYNQLRAHTHMHRYGFL